MSLIHRRQRHALIMILVYVAGILAACGEAPAPPSCYIYDFTLDPVTSEGAPINLIGGEWIPGVGIATVENEIVANWTEPFYFLPQGIYISVLRPDGVSGEIEVSALADAFGRHINDTFALPSDVDEGTGRIEWDYPLTGSPILEGNTFNGVIQTDQPLIVTSITVVLRADEPSPYPVNSCADDPTPEPSQTATVETSTPTATSTATHTGTAATSTPSCGNTDYLASSVHWSGGRSFATAGGPLIRIPNGNPSTGVVTTLQLVLPEPLTATQITIEWGRTYTTSPDSSLVEIYAQPGDEFVMSFTGAEAMAKPYTLTTTLQVTHPGHYTTHLDVVYTSAGGTGAFGPRRINLSDCTDATPTPTATATATFTPTGATDTRTPLPTPATQTATFTNVGISTSTPMFTNTPLGTIPPTLTSTDTPTCPFCPTFLPPDTATPANTLTRVPLPTPRFTTTAWPTYPGPALTAIPGGTAQFMTLVVTPRVGTLASTPIRRGTALPVPGDLDEHRPGVRDYLQTAVGYVNELPRDIGGIAPSISGTFPIFAGYAKWAMSSVSLQEIFGQRIYPIPQHMFYGVTVIILFAVISLTFKLVLFFVKLALWIVRFILKIIPFIG